MKNEIIEALEATATVRKDRGGICDPRTSDKGDILVHRAKLLLFLESLDDDISIGDLRHVLEEYD